jgi:radical SAM superfamily enzyme YgiQ (UPF0313 family)
LKLALISPKGTTFGKNPEFQKLISGSTNLSKWRNIFTGFAPGLLVIASLTPDSWDIELIDENIEPIDFKKKYDLVGVTAMTQQATRAYEIADLYRQKGIKTIFGGIHATVLPDEAKKHFDSVVVGEAENIWPQILEHFSQNALKPVYASPKEVDLSKAPLPRYELLRDKFYNTIWIQTTRGCPHDCEFCAATKVFGPKYRRKGIHQVINEIKYVRDSFPKSRIAFADDNLLADKKLSKQLLKEIIPLKIRYHAQSDISVADDDELLELLVQSGCSFLLVGFESISEASLQGIDKSNWKSKHVKSYASSIRKIQSLGIGILGAFIVGLDNDDVSVFPRLADFVVENNLFETQVTISTPLPGTRLRERLVREGRLLSAGWDNYTFADVNFIPKKMSINKLENGFVQVYKSVDERLGYFAKFEYFRKIQKELLLKGVKK